MAGWNNDGGMSSLTLVDEMSISKQLLVEVEELMERKKNLSWEGVLC